MQLTVPQVRHLIECLNSGERPCHTRGSYNVRNGALDTECWYNLFDDLSRTFYPLEIDKHHFYDTRLVTLRHNASEDCVKVKRDMRAIVCRYLASKMRCLSQRYFRNNIRTETLASLPQPLGEPTRLLVPNELRFGIAALRAMRLRMLPADPDKSLKFDTLRVRSTNDSLFDVFSARRTRNREHTFYGFGNEYELSIESDGTFIIRADDLSVEAVFHRAYFRYFDNIGNCAFVLRCDNHLNAKDRINKTSINMKYEYDACLLRLDDSLIPVSRYQQPLLKLPHLPKAAISVLEEASNASARILEFGVGTHVTRIKAKRSSERVLRREDFSRVKMEMSRTASNRVVVSAVETMCDHERNNATNIVSPTYRVFGERDGTVEEIHNFMDRSRVTEKCYIVLPLFFRDSVGYLYRVAVRAFIAMLDQTEADDIRNDKPINRHRCTLNIECENVSVPIAHFHYYATLLYAYFAYQLIVYNVLRDKRIDTRSSTFTSFAEMYYTSIERARVIYEQLRVTDLRCEYNTPAAVNTKSANSTDQADHSVPGGGADSNDNDNIMVATTDEARVFVEDEDEVPVMGSDLLTDTHFIKLALQRICGIGHECQQLRKLPDKYMRLSDGNGATAREVRGHESDENTSSRDNSTTGTEILEQGHEDEDECEVLVGNNNFLADYKNRDVLDLESRFLLNVYALHCIKYKL